MRTTRSARVLVPVFALAVAATGLMTSSVGAAPAVKAKDACDLVTTADIEEVFGVPVEDGEGAPDLAGNGTQCEWQIGDPDGNETNGSLTARLQRGGGRTGAKAIYDTSKDTALESDDGVEVDGIGKDAYFNPAVGLLEVLKNKKTAFYFAGTIFEGATAGVIDDAELQPMLEQLAEIALPEA
jgi:hypothetical protein